MQSKISFLARVALFIALIIVGSFLRLPLPFLGVSFTLQTVFVMLSGFLLGKKGGALAATLYVILGLIGLPIFSRGGGLAYVFQYEFGYLLGFIAMAALSGFSRHVAPKKNRFAAWFSMVLLPIAGLYAIALPYVFFLSHLYFNRAIPIKTLLISFCLAFLPTDILKGIIAVYTAKRLRKTQ